MKDTILCSPQNPRGARFIPFGMASQLTNEIEMILVTTECSHLEAHCEDGSVLASGAWEPGSLLAQAAQRGGESFVIGFSARDHTHIADRPLRSVFHQLKADVVAARDDQSYQPRFLSTKELTEFLHSGRAGRLDPSDYSHRLTEIEKVMNDTPAEREMTTIRNFLRSAQAYAHGGAHIDSRQLVQVYTTNPATKQHSDEDTEIILLPCPTANIEESILSPRHHPTAVAAGQLDLWS